MTAIDHSRLAARVKAREYATACIELMDECAEELPLEALGVFWETIRERLDDEPSAAAAALTRAKSIIEPMTDARAECFGLDRLMPFGKYKDQRICDVPLRYLDWLIDAPDEFKDELRQYLNNEKIAARLAEELEGSGWRLDE